MPLEMKENEYWLTAAEAARVKEQLKDAPNGRYSKYFFTHSIHPMPADESKIEADKLYVNRNEDGSFNYTCITPSGQQVTKTVTENELKEALKDPSIKIKDTARNSQVDSEYSSLSPEEKSALSKEEKLELLNEKKQALFNNLYEEKNWEKTLPEWEQLLIEVASKNGDIPPKLSFGIIKSGDKNSPEYFAIGHGAQRGEALGEGSFGKAKLIQDITPLINQNSRGEPWIGVLKVLSGEAKEEYNFLNKLGLIRGEYIIREKADVSGGTKETHHIIMERAPGQSLEKLIKEGVFANLSSADRLDAVAAVLNAVNAFNQKGFSHCDIKPANIIYDVKTKKATLIDFGTAGEMGKKYDEYKGSPAYSAPEIKPEQQCKLFITPSSMSLKEMESKHYSEPTYILCENQLYYINLKKGQELSKVATLQNDKIKSLKDEMKINMDEDTPYIRYLPNEHLKIMTQYSGHVHEQKKDFDYNKADTYSAALTVQDMLGFSKSRIKEAKLAVKGKEKELIEEQLKALTHPDPTKRATITSILPNLKGIKETRKSKSSTAGIAALFATQSGSTADKFIVASTADNMDNILNRGTGGEELLAALKLADQIVSSALQEKQEVAQDAGITSSIRAGGSK